MEITKLTKYILNNDLSEEQVIKILRELKQDSFQYGYIRGYWTRDSDLRRIQSAKKNRLKKEYEEKTLNQNN